MTTDAAGGFTFLEFFAGGGMARAGLGPGWRCLFANDVDPAKAASYAENWGGEHLRVGDVAALTADDLPDRADLAWSSFPCQDLSLAGAGAGLDGRRSGAFWPFWRLVEALGAAGRGPSIVALENVCGLLAAHGGADFRTLVAAVAGAGYVVGALTIDAAFFLPQSRPRLFVVAARRELALPDALIGAGPAPAFASPALLRAVDALPPNLRTSWRWWRLPDPPPRTARLADLLESAPRDVAWKSRAETARLCALMSEVNRARLDAARAAGGRVVGTLYRRTRAGADGERRQRAELRFDGLAGCLRTPAGGSSRQLLVVVEGARLDRRLLSARETARLMGLPDTYLLPTNYNAAYRLAGDGVAAPVVRHLAAHLIEPALAAGRTRAARRAA